MISYGCASITCDYHAVSTTTTSIHRLIRVRLLKKSFRGEQWSQDLTRSGTRCHCGSHRRLALTHFGHKFEQNAISCHGKENARQREHAAQ